MAYWAVICPTQQFFSLISCLQLQGGFLLFHLCSLLIQSHPSSFSCYWLFRHAYTQKTLFFTLPLVQSFYLLLHLSSAFSMLLTIPLFFLHAAHMLSSQRPPPAPSRKAAVSTRGALLADSYKSACQRSRPLSTSLSHNSYKPSTHQPMADTPRTSGQPEKTKPQGVIHWSSCWSPAFPWEFTLIKDLLFSTRTTITLLSQADILWLNYKHPICPKATFNFLGKQKQVKFVKTKRKWSEKKICGWFLVSNLDTNSWVFLQICSTFRF